jgi:hypothetical protein
MKNVNKRAGYIPPKYILIVLLIGVIAVSIARYFGWEL